MRGVRVLPWAKDPCPGGFVSLEGLRVPCCGFVSLTCLIVACCLQLGEIFLIFCLQSGSGSGQRWSKYPLPSPYVVHLSVPMSMSISSSTSVLHSPRRPVLFIPTSHAPPPQPAIADDPIPRSPLPNYHRRALEKNTSINPQNTPIPRTLFRSPNCPQFFFVCASSFVFFRRCRYVVHEFTLRIYTTYSQAPRSSHSPVNALVYLPICNFS